MLKRLMAMVLVLAMPTSVSAGPIKDAVEKAGRELALGQTVETRDRGRFWTAIALIGGGGLLMALGGLELGDDENGPDDGEDMDDSDDGEDSDGWGNKAMIGGGIAAAALGGVPLFKGRKSGPVVSVHPGSVVVRQKVRFQMA